MAITKRNLPRPLMGAALIALTLAGALSSLQTHASSSSSNARHVIPGHHVPKQDSSQVVGSVDPQETISTAIAFSLQNESELDALIQNQYTPGTTEYGQYLTPDEFATRFAPTQADYDQVSQYLQAQGLKVVGTHANRMILDVQGSAQQIENTFQIKLKKYQDKSGKTFRAPDQDPSLPEAIGQKVAAVAGLDTATMHHPQYLSAALNSGATGNGIGTGVGSTLSPNDIRAAYNTTGISQNGAGQTLALFELDGYNASDISAYEKQYGLPAVPLQNVLVDGVTGSAGSAVMEVDMDIELMIAMAPGVSKIMVYEGPNSGNGILDTYNRIATDNIAKAVSTSWGMTEANASSSMKNSENTIFKQMAAQGQTIFAAAGDKGAYDDGTNIGVEDPASQPYVTSVGGTSLAVNSNMTYSSESIWNNGSAANGAGGGGISTYWSLPTWQQGMISSSSLGSTTKRNVPDVSLDANPNTGYSAYVSGSWYAVGGTSAGAPLWAAFAAIMNQKRASLGMSALGYANPTFYQLAQTSNGSTSFHDVTSGNNLYYPAVTGYDLASGLGSFNGANLFAQLTASASPSPSPTVSPSPSPSPSVSPSPTPTSGTNWVKCATENGTCTFSGTHTVRYGTGTSWVTKVATGSIACNNSVFGDPAYGYAKECDVDLSSSPSPSPSPTATATPSPSPTVTVTPSPSPTPTATTWTKCASENGTCTFSGTKTVRYGTGSSWYTKTATSSIACNNATFGDPAYGYVKECDYAN